MTLNEELDYLKKAFNLYIKDSSNNMAELNYLGQLQKIKDNFTSEEDIKKIDAFIRKGMSDLTQDLKEFNQSVILKMKLSEVTEIVSVSYISKTYFNKSRQWFYQRLNGNVVNGKIAEFTNDELEKLNFALQDISKKIGSVSIS